LTEVGAENTALGADGLNHFRQLGWVMAELIRQNPDNW
jgi:hypothetical protein